MFHFRMLASQTLRGMIAELTGMDVARLGIQMLGPSALICFTKDGGISEKRHPEVAIDVEEPSTEWCQLHLFLL